ncbi:MAG: hypothetical protein J6Y87_09320, partial [Muribaculaceae bacterium]|nr:hypothetical protein [Muribaculaceae bacterium]
ARAYHALLTVQALYKAYIPATSDTLIRRAWDYYRDHGSYDRRIRAMLYSGTVAEELGHPDSAMRWYKRTELESHPDDHYHRGYALMSMAYLYQFQYISTEKCIYKNKQALQCFKKAHDKKLEVTCLSNIGNNYSLINRDSAYKYIQEAIKYSTLIHDTVLYNQNLESLVGLYYRDSSWTNVKEYAIKLIKNGIAYNNQSNLFFVAQSYLHLNEVDSAILMLNNVRLPLQSTKDSVLYYRTHSLLEEKLGHYRNSKIFAEKAGEIADSEIIANNRYNLSLAEREYPTFVLEDDNHTLQKSNIGLKYIIFLCSVIILSLVIFFRYRLRNFKAQFTRQREKLNSAHLQLQELHNDLSRQKLEAEQANHTDDEILRKIGLHSYCVNELFKGVVYSGKRGASIFKLLFEGESKKESGIISVKVPDDFWSKLGEYVDAAYPHALENMKKAGIELTEKEANIISLDCLQIPNAVIEHILGYGERSLAPIKSKLISEIGGGETDIIKILQKYSDQ